jgi:hypothetical protein
MAGLIALPMAIAATAMGIYNAVQIENLKAELTDIRADQSRLFNIVRDLAKEIDSIYDALDDVRQSYAIMIAFNPALFDSQLSRLDSQLRNRLIRATNAIQTAMFRRLSVDYLTPHEIRQVYERVKSRARELGYELLIDHHTDIFQVEATLLFDGDDGHILVHIPIAPASAILNLFRLQPFPLPFFEGHYLVPDVKNDVLGLSAHDNRMGTVLSSQDLLACHRVNQRFMCSNHGVLSKNLTNTCLGLLYLQNFPLAQKICKFEVTPIEERIYQLRKNWYITYLTKPMTVPIRCQNGTLKDHHLRDGVQNIHISPGCMATFDHHVVYSDFSMRLDTEMVIYEWAWEPITFLPDEHRVEILQELQTIVGLGVARPRLSDLVQYHTRHSAGRTFQQGFYTAVAIIIAVCIVVIVLIVWCYRRRNRKMARRRQEQDDAELPRSWFARMMPAWSPWHGYQPPPPTYQDPRYQQRVEEMRNLGGTAPSAPQ